MNQVCASWGLGGVTALAVVLVVVIPDVARAGMPPPFELTELSKLRVQSISFFLMVLLASAAVIRLLWNNLAKSFPRLPRLNYWRALALVLLWGLLFIVVLAMISGGRELMTPGAWERKGSHYRLRTPTTNEAYSQ